LIILTKLIKIIMLFLLNTVMKIWMESLILVKSTPVSLWLKMNGEWNTVLDTHKFLVTVHSTVHMLGPVKTLKMLPPIT